MVTVGEPFIDPTTSIKLYPITVLIPYETVCELSSAFVLDMRDELTKIIGEDVISAAVIHHSTKKYADTYPIE